jgi:putative transposase
LATQEASCSFRSAIWNVFRSDGIEIIRTPFRTPQANGVAERVFVTHYNEHRPHRALSLAPPEPRCSSVASAAGKVRLRRRDRLGGLIHEYILAA